MKLDMAYYSLGLSKLMQVASHFTMNPDVPDEPWFICRIQG